LIGADSGASVAAGALRYQSSAVAVGATNAASASAKTIAFAGRAL